MGTQTQRIPTAGEQEETQSRWKGPRVSVLAQASLEPVDPPGSSLETSPSSSFCHFTTRFLFPALGTESRNCRAPCQTHLFPVPMEKAVVVSTPRQDHTGRVRIAKKGPVGSSGCPETSPCSRFELGAEGIAQGRAGGCQGWMRGSAEGAVTFLWPPGKSSLKNFLFPSIRLLGLIISKCTATRMGKSKLSSQGGGAGQCGQGWQGHRGWGGSRDEEKLIQLPGSAQLHRTWPLTQLLVPQGSSLQPRRVAPARLHQTPARSMQE